MSRSTEKIIENILELERIQKRLMRFLLRERQYAIGSVSVVHRKCGKPTCHCATNKGHEQTLFLFKDRKGKRICKLVRIKDQEYMQEIGDNYREFKLKLRELRATQNKIEEKLMALLRRQSISYK